MGFGEGSYALFRGSDCFVMTPSIGRSSKSSSVAMVVVGIDAVVRHHTRAAALMLTGTDNDLVGRLFPALFVAASQEGVDAFLRRGRCTPTEVTPMEATCCLVHGDERFIEMTAVNLVDSPEVDGLVISLANRTEAHRALDVANRKADFDALTGSAQSSCVRGICVGTLQGGSGRSRVRCHARRGSVEGPSTITTGTQPVTTCCDPWRTVVQRRIGSAGTVARIGGDEFAVVLPYVNRETAKRLIGAVCKAIQAPIEGTDTPRQRHLRRSALEHGAPLARADAPC